MRNSFSDTLASLYGKNEFIFLTGDLVFMALENLMDVMGGRFINAGVAEQNMVSVAAGIASTGLQTWVYSIASFIYTRPFEQIRNDVCMHDLDVKIVGNGGGYGYGAMGATHHALEDYGTLLTLQNMRIYIPAFARDVPVIVSRMAGIRKPAYLRLGKCELPKGFDPPSYAPWRKLSHGARSLILAVGPLAGTLLLPLQELAAGDRPELWVLTELPVAGQLPQDFLESLDRCGNLIVVEEHILHGSVGQMISYLIMTSGVKLSGFRHVCAKGYPSGCFGSQAFHRKESGLDPASILHIAVGSCAG
jgi:transketolase